MNSYPTPTFSLHNFEGTLELLLYLIQKEEIDICSIAIKQLTLQFLQTWASNPEVEHSSDTLLWAASLLLIKSQKLLPSLDTTQPEESDFGIDMLQGLLDYFTIKERAQLLSLREEQQRVLFPRNPPQFQKERPSGLDGVEIQTLKQLFADLLAKAENHPKQIIDEEEWTIPQKADWLRNLLKVSPKWTFEQVFTPQMGRLEIVVVFLTLLEMVKQQEVLLVQENENVYITLKTNVLAHARDEPH